MGLGLVLFASPEITGTINSLSGFPKSSKDSSLSVCEKLYITS